MEFRDNSFMDDNPPACAHANFEAPRLRQCPTDPATIDWETARLLDYGMDGCVYRVTMGGQGPYALKLFRDNKVSTLPPIHYFAAQRECQNAALIQMLGAAIEEANTASAPIKVSASPEGNEEALFNLLSFADEHRRAASIEIEGPVAAVVIDTIPRFVKCYGWPMINENGLPRRLNLGTVEVSKESRSLFKGEDHIAIVYEYIEDGDNDPAKVEVSRFLWLTGFGYGSSRKENWKQGIFVDHSDYVFPRGLFWHEAFHSFRSAERILR